MKKAYSKPALFAESFELAEHIALCSGYDGTNNTANHWSTNCRFNDPDTGVAMFLSSENGCVELYADRTKVKVDCYNAPTDGDGHPFAS